MLTILVQIPYFPQMVIHDFCFIVIYILLYGEYKSLLKLGEISKCLFQNKDY